MNDADRARAWREEMNLSRGELSALTGFSVESIINFEMGYRRGTKEPISETSRLRYKLCCASVAHRLQFNW